MKAAIILKNTTFIGIEGKGIEEIKDKVAHSQGLSKYGRSLLIVNPRKVLNVSLN
jgi:hypothetical protein